jgi:hypothetical protein
MAKLVGYDRCRFVFSESRLRVDQYLLSNLDGLVTSAIDFIVNGLFGIGE